jgi:hypothetical protein
MLEVTKVKRRAPSMTRAGRGVVRKRYRPPRPQQLRTPTNATDRALQLLWPNDLHRQAAACLGAAAETIRGWRRKLNPTPQWALDRIITELRKTAADRMAAADMLEREKGRG